MFSLKINNYIWENSYFVPVEQLINSWSVLVVLRIEKNSLKNFFTRKNPLFTSVFQVIAGWTGKTLLLGAKADKVLRLVLTLFKFWTFFLN